MTETRHDTGYERLLEDFGRQLEEAETRPAGRQSRRRPVTAGAFVLAGIVAGTVMLSGAGGGGRLGIVAQAKAALTPLGHVVHLVTTSHMEMRGSSQAEILGPEAEDNTPRVAEQWSTSEPTRWRVASTVPIVTAHGTSTGPVQLSYGDGAEELYVQPLNALDVTTGVSEDSSRESLSEGPIGTEPVPQIRSMLEAGQLHNAGSGIVDGHAVLRLVGDEPRGTNSPPWPVEYDVDPGTYAPVRFTVEDIGRSIPGNAGTLTVVVAVDTYEELPLNETTNSLLSVKVTGNPTIHHYQTTNAQSARHTNGRG